MFEEPPVRDAKVDGMTMSMEIKRGKVLVLVDGKTLCSSKATFAEGELPNGKKVRAEYRCGIGKIHCTLTVDGAVVFSD